MDSEKLAERKRFLGLSEVDAAHLRAIHDQLAEAKVGVIDELYAHWATFEETGHLLRDPAVVARLKRSQGAYFDQLTAGTYDDAYVENRLGVGRAHQRVGLSPQWYIGAYAQYLAMLLPHVAESAAPEARTATIAALLRAAFLDIGLALDAYVDAEKQALVAAQSRAEGVETRFREVVEHANDAVVLTDDRGRVSYFNAAAEALFGHRREDVLGMPLAMLVPARARALHEQSSERARPEVEVSGTRRVEALRKDGQFIPVDCTLSACVVDGRTVHIAILRDMGEREAAEAALRRSEASFRALIESSPDAVAVHREGRFVYVNPALLDYLGYERASELVGEPVDTVIAPESRALVAAATFALAAGRRSQKPAELHLVRRDGSLVVGEAVGLATDFDGAPAVVAIVRDVSERKQLALKAVQMDRFIAMGTLAAGVGHEINNPLAYVAGNVEHAITELAGLADEMESSATSAAPPRPGPGCHFCVRLREVREALTEAQDGVGRIRHVLRDLKLFSRSADEHVEPLALGRAIEPAVNMAWNEIKHRARLVKDFGDVPSVMGNEPRLGQVFLNLLINAAQAIPEGDPERNEIRVKTRVEGAHVVVEISDTGTGMPPDVVARIFEPFWTTKRSREGTGLGLAISRRIVESFGGTIEAESALGVGSVFRVSLPAAPKAVAPNPSQPAQSASAPPRRKVLVIDDEPLVGSALRRLLQKGHDVCLLQDARIALEKLRAGEAFDLIFCDLMMPGMSGMDFHAVLSDEFPELLDRLVFTTGGACTQRARDFLGSAHKPVLEKPFTAMAVEAVVRDASMLI